MGKKGREPVYFTTSTLTVTAERIAALAFGARRLRWWWKKLTDGNSLYKNQHRFSIR